MSLCHALGICAFNAETVERDEVVLASFSNLLSELTSAAIIYRHLMFACEGLTDRTRMRTRRTIAVEIDVGGVEFLDASSLAGC